MWLRTCPFFQIGGVEMTYEYYKEKFIKIKGKVTYVYLLIMFGFFMLYLANQYTDVPMAKVMYFRFFTIPYVIIMIGLHVVQFVKTFDAPISLKERLIQYIKDVSITDWFMLLFLIGVTISLFIAPDFQQAMYGYQSRHMGYQMMFFMIVVYYYVSRYYQHEQSALLLMMTVASIVNGIAILNYFYIDPLGYYDNIGSYKNIFFSTIGNTNFLSSLISITLPFSTVLLCTCKEKLSTIIYGASMVTGVIAVLAINSDSGYLALFATFSFLFIYVVKDTRMLKRYLLILIAFFSSAKVLYFLNQKYMMGIKELDSLTKVVAEGSLAYFAIALLLALYLILWKHEIKIQRLVKKIPIRAIVFGLVCLFIVTVLGVFYYFSFVDTTSSLGGFEKYLRFNDVWGSGRGEAWRYTFEAFPQLPLLNKVFGSGLESSNIMFYNTLGQQAAYWDNVHNEYLNYLIVGGYFTLFAYVMMNVTMIGRVLLSKFKDPYMIAIAATVFSYLIQSSVNIATPMATPMFFIMLGILEGIQRLYRKEGQEEI